MSFCANNDLHRIHHSLCLHLYASSPFGIFNMFDSKPNLAACLDIFLFRNALEIRHFRHCNVTQDLKKRPQRSHHGGVQLPPCAHGAVPVIEVSVSLSFSQFLSVSQFFICFVTKSPPPLQWPSFWQLPEIELSASTLGCVYRFFFGSPPFLFRLSLSSLWLLPGCC